MSGITISPYSLYGQVPSSDFSFFKIIATAPPPPQVIQTGIPYVAWWTDDPMRLSGLALGQYGAFPLKMSASQLCKVYYGAKKWKVAGNGTALIVDLTPQFEAEHLPVVQNSLSVRLGAYAIAGSNTNHSIDLQLTNNAGNLALWTDNDGFFYPRMLYDFGDAGTAQGSTYANIDDPTNGSFTVNGVTAEIRGSVGTVGDIVLIVEEGW